MTTEIKEYKELTMIYLKDGDALRTTLTPEQVVDQLNKSEFLVIDGVGFNRYEVKTFKKYQPDDIEQFCLSQGKEKRDILFGILKERKEKGLRTKSIQHLLSIYNSRYEQG